MAARGVAVSVRGPLRRFLSWQHERVLRVALDLRRGTCGHHDAPYRQWRPGRCIGASAQTLHHVAQLVGDSATCLLVGLVPVGLSWPIGRLHREVGVECCFSREG